MELPVWCNRSLLQRDRAGRACLGRGPGLVGQVNPRAAPRRASTAPCAWSA